MVLIKINSKSFKFNLEFHGKFSFILGNSGSRKTHFVSLCAKLRNRYKSVSGSIYVDGRLLKKEDINIFSNENMQVDYESLLKTKHNCLFLIDEYSDIHHFRELSSWLQGSDNYFIFISRKVYGFLPVNVQSVYIFERVGDQITNTLKYSKFKDADFSKIKYILTEDSSSGRQFFERNFKDIEVCKSTGELNGKKLSRDNSQLHNFLEEDLKRKDHILVVYDSAAYAPFYESLADVLLKAKKNHKDVKILDWESFETYLLALPMFGENYDLDAPGCFFNSLEQMCEERLAVLLNYRKNSLPPCFDKNKECSQCKSLKKCSFSKKRFTNEIIVGSLKSMCNVFLDDKTCF